MTSRTGLRQFRLLPSLLFAATVMAACATAPTRPPASISTGQPRPDPVITQPQPSPPDISEPIIEQPVVEDLKEVEDTSRYVVPDHMIGRDIKRVGVLLPFSHSSSSVRNQASSLLAAIEMALFDQNNADILILPKDTGGDPRKTTSVAEEVIAEGADIIIGPLFAENVRAASNVARLDEIPVIAFSNDLTAAGGGAFLMSFPPEEEVARVVDWAVLNGINRFAFIGPRTDYARRVETALRFEAARRSSIVLAAEFYDPGNEAPVDEARRLADRIGFALNSGAPKVAVMIPDRGTNLLSVAPLLPYYSLDLQRLQYIGTSLWDDESIWREPVLSNAKFAAPPPEDLDMFTDGFESNYGRSPASLASLGYDAAALSIAFLGDGEISAEELRDLDGFRGVNGLFRFRSDGTIDRGLAVLSITPRGPVVEDAGPDSFRPDVN